MSDQGTVENFYGYCPFTEKRPINALSLNMLKTQFLHNRQFADAIISELYNYKFQICSCAVVKRMLLGKTAFY